MKANKTKKERKMKLSPPTTRGEFLELCIKLTKNAINNPPLESDKGMIDQIDRLTKELKEWRKNEIKG